MEDNLSKKLRKLRNEKGLTLSDVKNKTGINEGYVSKLERGIKRNPTMDMLEKFANLYNVTTDYLIGKNPFKNKVEAQHSISIAAVKHLKQNPDNIPHNWGIDSGLWALIDNGAKEEIITYSSDLLRKFNENKPLTNIELMELSNIMFSNIKWSTDYDGIVHLANFNEEAFALKMDFEKIDKITLDLNKSYLLKMNNGDQFNFEHAPSLFDFTSDDFKEKKSSHIPDPDKFKVSKMETDYTVPAQKIPILGCIAAGKPILADEQIEGYKYMPKEDVSNGEYFLLRVQGDSMIDAGIYDGDCVLIRKQPVCETGEIAVVIVDGENATLKRVYHHDGRLLLQPENKKYKAMMLDNEEVRIVGKAIEVVHQL